MFLNPTCLSCCLVSQPVVRGPERVWATHFWVTKRLNELFNRTWVYRVFALYSEYLNIFEHTLFFISAVFRWFYEWFSSDVTVFHTFCDPFHEISKWTEHRGCLKFQFQVFSLGLKLTAEKEKKCKGSWGWSICCANSDTCGRNW